MGMSKSVINFLEKNENIMTDYFKECLVMSKTPNYSEFCRKYLNGTTQDGVSFDSITIKRKEVTEYLRGKYSIWVNLK